jgi:hypothetical protein
MAKQGLWANINRRKRLGISRPKSKSTISKKAYANMKAGFPRKKLAAGSKAPSFGESEPSFLQRYLKALPVDDQGRSSIYKATSNYKKGGIVGKGQGKVTKIKITKQY